MIISENHRSEDHRLTEIEIKLDKLTADVEDLVAAWKAAAYRLEQDSKLIGKIFRPLIDYLFFFDPKHCEESYKSEFEKKQLPNEYRRE